MSTRKEVLNRIITEPIVASEVTEFALQEGQVVTPLEVDQRETYGGLDVLVLRKEGEEAGGKARQYSLGQRLGVGALFLATQEGGGADEGDLTTRKVIPLRFLGLDAEGRTALLARQQDAVTPPYYED